MDLKPALLLLLLLISSTSLIGQEDPFGDPDDPFGVIEEESDSSPFDDPDPPPAILDDNISPFGDETKGSLAPSTPRDVVEPLPTSQDRIVDQQADQQGYLPGKRFIRHPNARKGLIKITKDKLYRYKVRASPQRNAASVRFGLYDPTNLQNPNGLTFADIYSESQMPVLFIDYEWQTPRSFGKFALNLGTGLMVASGNGRFEDSLQEAREKFTFFAFPTHFGATYRFHYWSKQTFVPYIEGGVDLIPFIEVRDDDKAPKLGGASTAHASGGLAIRLNELDIDSLIELDREYGINTLYLVVEGRQYFKLANKFDFTSLVINGGIMAEF